MSLSNERYAIMYMKLFLLIRSYSKILFLHFKLQEEKIFCISQLKLTSASVKRKERKILFDCHYIRINKYAGGPILSDVDYG